MIVKCIILAKPFKSSTITILPVVVWEIIIINTLLYDRSNLSSWGKDKAKEYFLDSPGAVPTLFFTAKFYQDDPSL